MPDCCAGRPLVPRCRGTAEIAHGSWAPAAMCGPHAGILPGDCSRRPRELRPCGTRRLAFQAGAAKFSGLRGGAGAGACTAGPLRLTLGLAHTEVCALLILHLFSTLVGWLVGVLLLQGVEGGCFLLGPYFSSKLQHCFAARSCSPHSAGRVPEPSPARLPHSSSSLRYSCMVARTWLAAYGHCGGKLCWSGLQACTRSSAFNGVGWRPTCYVPAFPGAMTPTDGVGPLY